MNSNKNEIGKYFLDKTGLELVEMKYEDIVLLINFLPNLGIQSSSSVH